MVSPQEIPSNEEHIAEDKANGWSIIPIPEDNTTPLLISASPSTERNLDVTPSTRLETSSAQSLDNSTRAKHQDEGNGGKANNAVNLGWKDSAAEGGSSLKVGDQPESNGNTATSRIPYENGYGDLALVRLCDHQIQIIPPSYPSDTPSDDLQILAMGSGSGLLKGPYGFVRSGTFPYFKLPIELQSKVVNCLLEPFHSPGLFGGPSTIHIDIEPRYSPTSHKDEDSLKAAWQAIEKELPPHARVGYCDIENQRQTFYQNKLDEALPHRHPRRRASYWFTCSVANKTSGYAAEPMYSPETRKCINNLYCEWIRLASNASTQFREQLCTAFWSHVTIAAEWGEDEYARCMLAFLHDRPSICRGIKYVYLHFDMYAESDIHGARGLGEEFATWCKALSKDLKLDVLLLAFHLDNGDMQKFSTGTGKYAPLLACRNLCITQDLEVHFTSHLDETVPDFNHADQLDWYDEYEKYREIEERKHEVLARELLMPDSLRPHPQTEMSRYLDSRPKAPIEDDESSED